MKIGFGIDLLTTSSRLAAAASAAVTKMIIQGDSMLYAGGEGNGGAVYAYRDNPPSGKTVVLNVQGSRTIGGPAYAGPPAEGADAQDPNSLLAQRPTDIATGAQALMVMIGTNDLLAKSIGHYEADLINWAGPLRSAGTKIYWGFPVPMRTDGAYGEPGYSNWSAKRVGRATQWRNPAVWGQWADGYFPIGEIPEFNLADNTAYISSDGVHPTVNGQAKFLVYIQAVGNSIFDATRQGSTQMYSARWPASATNQDVGAVVTARIIVSGLDPAGTALGASITGAGSPSITLNTGSPASVTGTTVGTGSGNGYRLYNGDTLDVSLTMSSSNSTSRSIDLTIGSETRTITFTTVAAVTSAGYSHGDVVGQTPVSNTHTYSAANFPASGLALIWVAPAGTLTGVSVGGAAASPGMATQDGDYGQLGIRPFLVPVTAGPHDIVLTYSNGNARSVISFGTLTDVDPTPVNGVSQNTDAVNGDGDPHETPGSSVPSSGIAVGAISIDTGDPGPSITGSTGGGTFIDSGACPAYQGEVYSMGVSKRTTTGRVGWNTSYGPHARAMLVFKANGT